MKIDFSTVLQDPDNPSEQAKDSKGVLITLGVIARSALNSELQDERRNGEDKYASYKLADKIRTSTKPLDLKADQIVLIKQRIGKAYPAGVSGQCWDLLELPFVEIMDDVAAK